MIYAIQKSLAFHVQNNVIVYYNDENVSFLHHDTVDAVKKESLVFSSFFPTCPVPSKLFIWAFSIQGHCFLFFKLVRMTGNSHLLFHNFQKIFQYFGLDKNKQNIAYCVFISANRKVSNIIFPQKQCSKQCLELQHHPQMPTYAKIYLKYLTI